MPSPFFHPGTHTQRSQLSILHLRRDQLIPVTLETRALDDGYAEGPVVNTRFGSYPHTTLVDQEWGTQVVASKVDTGSRGWANPRKRKLAGEAEEDGGDTAPAGKRSRSGGVQTNEKDDGNDMRVSGSSRKQKAAVRAASGFCHILPPTPETWTMSLPHRTQVVYTPDYSFILQKMRVRPGDTLIEAGAGSGSFSHAAARAVFNGYGDAPLQRYGRKGRVRSFEYHEPRAKQLQEEIELHELQDTVIVTHRDVTADGFALPLSVGIEASKGATRVFLDLPAPWDALPHLTRTARIDDFGPALDPNSTIHICCFLPCIEQVSKCIASLRSHHWIEIEMFELAQRRLEVRRERIGLHLEGLRNVNATAATVQESIERLKEIEIISRNYRDDDGDKTTRKKAKDQNRESKQERLARFAREEKEERKVFKDGRLVIRTEPEIRTHTSYLIFAVLPVGNPYEGDDLIVGEMT